MPSPQPIKALEYRIVPLNNRIDPFNNGILLLSTEYNNAVSEVTSTIKKNELN